MSKKSLENQNQDQTSTEPPPQQEPQQENLKTLELHIYLDQSNNGQMNQGQPQQMYQGQQQQMYQGQQQQMYQGQQQQMNQGQQYQYQPPMNNNPPKKTGAQCGKMHGRHADSASKKFEMEFAKLNQKLRQELHSVTGPGDPVSCCPCKTPIGAKYLKETCPSMDDNMQNQMPCGNQMQGGNQMPCGNQMQGGNSTIETTLMMDAHGLAELTNILTRQQQAGNQAQGCEQMHESNSEINGQKTTVFMNSNTVREITNLIAQYQSNNANQ